MTDRAEEPTAVADLTHEVEPATTDESGSRPTEQSEAPKHAGHELALDESGAQAVKSGIADAEPKDATVQHESNSLAVCPCAHVQ